MALTTKQIAFCEQYIIDHSATRAAKDAGYSANSAGMQGWRLLQMPSIKEKIDELNAARAKRLEISADRVLDELAKIAFVDPTAIFDVDENGNMTFDGKLSDLPPDERACIASVSQNTTKEGGSITIKLHDKLAALEKIGKHLKLFTDVQENKHTFTQMGQVLVGVPDGKDGSPQRALEFDIGSEANIIDQ